MPEPWERQRDAKTGELEPNLWYDRFTDFRLMGPDRSLLELVNRERDKKGHRRTNCTPGSWRRNSERWNWRERAEAWDAEQRRLRIEAEKQARAEMLKRHARQAQALQGIGAMRLQLFDHKRLAAMEPEQRAREIKNLTLGEARRYILDGTTLERQALGLPEHLLAVAGMTDEELRKQYAGLIGAITPIGSDAGGDAEAGDGTAASTEIVEAED